MGILNKLKKAKNTKGETDYVGNRPLESDIVLCTIDCLFIDEYASGALFAHIDYTTESGKKLSENITISNKEKQTYYERNDEKFDLPGYALINSILRLTIDETLDDAETEMKNVKVYQKGKQVTAEREVITEVTGAEIYLGIRKVLYTKQNDGSTGTTNKINKAFCADEEYEFATVPELDDEAEEFTFYQVWLENNKDQTFDETDNNSGKGKGNRSSRNSDDDGDDKPARKRRRFK